jgi:hypothetical protein
MTAARVQPIFAGAAAGGSRLPSGRSIEASIKPKVYERSRAENLTLGYFTRLPTTNQRWRWVYLPGWGAEALQLWRADYVIEW